MKLYDWLDRQTFQRMDPERAHELALRGLARAQSMPGGLSVISRYAPELDERLRIRLWGLPFPNPLGVAAGMDKNGVAATSLLTLGFGHVEVGTVTLQPQPGNDRPRLWRLPEQRAVINALGFPSDGAAAVRSRVLAARPPGIIGINIGKNHDIEAEGAPEAYAALMLALGDVASYITVNVSSPNTPGLRSLQMSNELTAILKAVVQANHQLAAARKQHPKPLLVKIAPDLSRDEIEAVASTALSSGADGIVATNTTTDRSGIPESAQSLPGGLSGPALRDKATDVVRIIHCTVGDQLPIIGVGGISNAQDVIERMCAGASLVQIYTAFIYEGPSLPGTILRDLSAFVEREGLRHISEIVGIGDGAKIW